MSACLHFGRQTQVVLKSVFTNNNRVILLFFSATSEFSIKQ